jgi:hypothetical protein
MVPGAFQELTEIYIGTLSDNRGMNTIDGEVVRAVLSRLPRLRVLDICMLMLLNRLDGTQ